MNFTSNRAKLLISISVGVVAYFGSAIAFRAYKSDPEREYYGGNITDVTILTNLIRHGSCRPAGLARVGYMGVAIAISGDRYFYWMYSDIPFKANFPYTGSFKIEDGVLVLGSPTEYTTGVAVDASGNPGLYSDRWRILARKLLVSLHSATDNFDDHARTLIPDCQFDPSDPFLNQSYLQPEAGTGQPATRSDSDSEGDDKLEPESEGRSR